MTDEYNVLKAVEPARTYHSVLRQLCLEILPKWSMGRYDPGEELPRPGRMNLWLTDVAMILLIIGFLYESDSTMQFIL